MMAKKFIKYLLFINRNNCIYIYIKYSLIWRNEDQKHLLCRSSQKKCEIAQIGSYNRWGHSSGNGPKIRGLARWRLHFIFGKFLHESTKQACLFKDGLFEEHCRQPRRNVWLVDPETVNFGLQQGKYPKSAPKIDEKRATEKVWKWISEGHRALQE